MQEVHFFAFKKEFERAWLMIAYAQRREKRHKGAKWGTDIPSLNRNSLRLDKYIWRFLGVHLPCVVSFGASFVLFLFDFLFNPDEAIRGDKVF